MSVIIMHTDRCIDMLRTDESDGSAVTDTVEERRLEDPPC